MQLLGFFLTLMFNTNYARLSDHKPIENSINLPIKPNIPQPQQS